MLRRVLLEKCFQEYLLRSYSQQSFFMWRVKRWLHQVKKKRIVFRYKKIHIIIEKLSCRKAVLSIIFFFWKCHYALLRILDICSQKLKKIFGLLFTFSYNFVILQCPCNECPRRVSQEIFRDFLNDFLKGFLKFGIFRFHQINFVEVYYRLFKEEWFWQSSRSIARNADIY